jgi:arylsulfatase A
MQRAIIISGMLLTLICSAVAVGEPGSKEHPNIILILSDDVGLGNIHCYGGPFNTPNIDKLASEGTKFTYCYATPLCGPSRCQLLTGRYPFRTGHSSNQSRTSVDPKREVMIPTVMKKAGYVTASVGKWGQIQFGPGEWGFDEYLVYPGSGRFWRAQTTTYNVNGKQKDLPEDTYLPTIMHDFATDFIDRHKDERFFLYYSMSHMHGPIVRTPDNKKGAEKDELYTANVEYMDKLVGDLVAELDKRNLRENTLVIFTGDNGTAKFGELVATVDGKKISGMKATMLEGGSRVPLIANWPGTTPAGKVNNDLTDFSDFFATSADLGGAKLPEGVKIDGQSFASQIRGEKGTPRDWVYVELNGKSYVRDGKYKLTAGGEMFDLTDAPFKEIPVAEDTSDEAAKAARKSLQAVLDEHKMLPPVPAAKQPPKQRRKARLQRAAAAVEPPTRGEQRTSR